ncbi:MAG: hypothetical protein KDH96_07955, partial [Candidatus Riesia sp.]|nr:hypothetical protein [Candidatus Riesia sp.]
IEVTNGTLDQFVPETSYTCYIIINHTMYTKFTLTLSSYLVTSTGRVYKYDPSFGSNQRSFDHQKFSMIFREKEIDIIFKLVPASKNNLIFNKTNNNFTDQITTTYTKSNITTTTTIGANLDLVTLKIKTYFEFNQYGSFI